MSFFVSLDDHRWLPRDVTAGQAHKVVQIEGPITATMKAVRGVCAQLRAWQVGPSLWSTDMLVHRRRSAGQCRLVVHVLLQVQRLRVAQIDRAKCSTSLSQWHSPSCLKTPFLKFLLMAFIEG